jgi:hypothetical protein
MSGAHGPLMTGVQTLSFIRRFRWRRFEQGTQFAVCACEFGIELQQRPVTIEKDVTAQVAFTSQ